MAVIPVLKIRYFLLPIFILLACNAFGQTVYEGLYYQNGTPVSVTIKDRSISAVRKIKKLKDQKSQIYVAPGLIDIQINGFMGVDFADQNLNPEQIRKATKALWEQGVTTFLPTLITAEKGNLIRSFSILSQVVDDPEIGASIPGFHLEGPYISPEKGYRGAHLEKYVRPPDWDEFQEFQKAANGKIKLITLAPEVVGVVPFITKCNHSGVVVSLGHHNGNAEQIKQAIDAGAGMATHLGNGCANLIDRHNNPLWPQLADDRISASLIVDGFHLNQQEVQCFYKMKGLNRTILVSDALDLAGLEPGEYTRGERKVLLTKDVVRYPEENVLAGAASPITVGVSNMMKFTNCSLGEAIQMASTNPAAILGLTEIGVIEPGKRADLIFFTLENGKVVIQKTIVAGKVVFVRK